MNKKGDLPVTILVIGILAVCVMALLVFYLNGLSIRENIFAGLDKIQDVNIKEEKGETIEKCTIGSCYKAEEIINYRRPWKDDKLLFKIEYYPR